MRPRFLAVVGGLLSLIGCADPNAPIRTRAGNLSQSQVDAIVEECGGHRGMAVIEGDQLVVYPARDISIRGCVLETLQATGETTLSSVGNQRYDTPAINSGDRKHEKQ